MLLLQLFSLNSILVYAVHRHELEQYGPDGLYTITYQDVHNDEDYYRLQRIDEEIEAIRAEYHERIAELFAERNEIIQRNYDSLVDVQEQIKEQSTYSPSCSPTETPTQQPAFKPTKSPSFRPTQKPTLSPTSLPTSQPTIQWASKPQKSKKSARREKKQSAKNTSANIETDDEVLKKYRSQHHPQSSNLGGTITFYEAEVPLRLEMERDAPINWPDDLFILSNLRNTGGSGTGRIKSYNSVGALLFNRIFEFNQCFKTYVYPNGTQQNKYNAKMIQEWVEGITFLMGAGTEAMKKVFDDAYDDLFTIYTTSYNVTIFQKALLIFIKRTFEVGEQILAKGGIGSISTPVILSEIFDSASGLNVVIDYYLCLFETVIEMEKDYIIKLHEPIKFMNTRDMKLGLDKTTRLMDIYLLRAVGALKDWLLVKEDELQNMTREEASSIAFERIGILDNCAHQWRFYKKSVDVARVVYDWKSNEKLKHLNIHIPWDPMDETEWNVMKGMLYAFGLEMTWGNINIIRYNVTLPVDKKWKKHKKGFASYKLTMIAQKRFEENCYTHHTSGVFVREILWRHC